MAQAFDPTVPATNAPLQSAPIRDNFISLNSCHSGDTSPPSPVAGQLWFDTGTNRLMRFDGVNWVKIDYNQPQVDSLAKNGQAGLTGDVTLSESDGIVLTQGPGTNINIGHEFTEDQRNAVKDPYDRAYPASATYPFATLGGLPQVIEYVDSGPLGIVQYSWHKIGEVNFNYPKKLKSWIHAVANIEVPWAGNPAGQVTTVAMTVIVDGYWEYAAKHTIPVGHWGNLVFQRERKLDSGSHKVQLVIYRDNPSIPYVNVHARILSCINFLRHRDWF